MGDVEAKIDRLTELAIKLSANVAQSNRLERARTHADELREMRAYRKEVFLIAVICLFAGLNLKDVLGLAGAIAVVGPVAGGGALWTLWPHARGIGDART